MVIPENRENGMDNTRSYIPISKGIMISHYKIIEKIGAGGMGEVYLALDTKLNRKVALKFLPPHLCQDEDCRKRFKREAQAAAKLDHPNIIHVYEVSEFKGRPYFAMQHVEGRSLRDFASEKELPVEQILELGIQICEGLNDAHEKGVTHRDIKPSNIIVDSHGRAKVVDFGLASVIGSDQLTKTGSSLGTIGYMSPEQVQGKEIDHRSDLFSLGVVLYELITKQNPFKRDSEAATLKAVSDDLPEPLARFKSGLPNGLQAIVDKALEKDVKTRYQHADGMLSDLMRVKRSLDSGQSAVSVSSRMGRSSRAWWVAGALVVVAAVIVLMLTKPWVPDTATYQPEKIMLAVLPFENLGVSEDEYFADGITEEILIDLAQLSGLGVISRTSAMRYKKTEKNLREIGAELGVDYVLEGTIRWDNTGDESRVRIYTQLIRVDDDVHLWAERYDAVIEDIFGLQSTIAGKVAEALRVNLVGNEKDLLLKRHTENLEAYNLYLKGRHFWNKRTEEGLQKSLAYFQQAIEKDSAYALAYAGIADYYNMLGWYSFLPPKMAFPKAKDAAKRALELDKYLAEAHTSLAHVNEYFDWDWLSAEKEYRRAIELNPGYATAHQWYAEFLSAMGRPEEAIAVGKRARELDPFSPVIGTNLAGFFFVGGQIDRAIEQYKNVLEMEPDFVIAHVFIAYAYVLKGAYQEAIAEVQKAIDLSGRDTPRILITRGYIYAISGEEDKAEQILDELKELSKQTYVSSWGIALIHVGLNQKDLAFEWLEKAYEERDVWLIYLRVIPMLDSLRPDPRFEALLKKMGLE